MTDVRVTHATRPTLEFRQQQRGETRREAQANIIAELGTDRTPLVHTETRLNRRTIRGTVTGNARAANDPNTSDPVQALANYLDKLESHVDEFQGFDGYTFEDDILGSGKRCAIESVMWERQTGQPTDIDFEIQVRIGRPTMEDKAITRRNPTVDTTQTEMLVVDGEPLPGLRQYKMERSIGLEVKGIWDRSTAENNDILMQEGAQQEVTFEGTITGSKASRKSKDQDLRAKLATSQPVTLATRFPGYDLTGYVVGYTSTQEVRHGTQVHDYTFQFVEGQKA